MQVDTAEFRAVVADVAEIKEMILKVAWDQGSDAAALAFAEASGLQRGLQMARGGHRAPRGRRDPASAAHLHVVGATGAQR